MFEMHPEIQMLLAVFRPTVTIKLTRHALYYCSYINPPEGRFFGYFLVALDKKVTRPPGRDPA
jgi:hypothetical protein